MNRATIVVHPSYVFALLALPAGTKHIGTGSDPDTGDIHVHVEHPDLPAGHSMAEPQYKSDGRGGAAFVGWGLKPRE